jgi:hypothetical protein
LNADEERSELQRRIKYLRHKIGGENNIISALEEQIAEQN